MPSFRGHAAPILAAAALPAVTAAQQTPAGAAVTREASAGAEIVRFTLPEGQVTVYLPGDFRPGDLISGQIAASPAGQGETRATNAAALARDVVEVGSVRAAVGDGMFRLKVGAAGAPELGVSLSSGSQVLARATVLATGSVRRGTGFVLPVRGQVTRLAGIEGAFDGDLDTTTLTIGGASAAVLAESPRIAVLMAPSQPVGPTTLSVRESAAQASGAFRNIGVALSAPKVDLTRGEQTTLTVQVSGLAGLAAPLPLTVEATPSVLLQGARTQTLTIDPASVDAEGRFVANLSIEAVVAGSFSIRASIGAVGAY